MPLNENAINLVYNNALGAVGGDKAAAAQLLKNAIKKAVNKKLLVHEPGEVGVDGLMDEEFNEVPIYDGDEDGEEEAIPDDIADEGDDEAPPEAEQGFIEIPPGNLEWNVVADNIGAAPAPMVGEVPLPPPANQFVGQFQEAAGGVPQHKVVLNEFALKQKAVYAGNHMGHGVGDPVGYGEKTADNSTRGLMVFYVNTAGLGSGAALDLLDKVKAQYKKVEANLATARVEVMWLPTGTGDTGAEFFSFR
jgi:hypothetical protein